MLFRSPHVVPVLDNIRRRLNNFLKKDIEFTNQINCIQFTKTYQNMYRSIHYLKYIADDYISQFDRHSTEDGTANSSVEGIDILIKHCLEKISKSWEDKQPTHLTIKKLLSVDSYIPI